MRAKEIWIGSGGNNPTDWRRLSSVYYMRMESSGSTHSSELAVECGRHAGTQPPDEWSCIQVRDPDNGNVLFFGRIDHVRPISSATKGDVWILHARDFIHTLTDNLVAHKLYHAWWGSFLPNWRIECEDGQKAGEGHCGIRRWLAFRDLAMSVRHGFGWVTAPNGSAFNMGDEIAPNYLDSPGLTIYDAMVQLAEGHPWFESNPSIGVGYDFRQRFHMQPPDLEYFQKGSAVWDITKIFYWQPWGGSPNLIPILSIDAEREGFSIYSRVLAHGHGDMRAHGKEYKYGVGWVHWGGTAEAAMADVRLLGMDGVWNPPYTYNLQREVYAHDASIADSSELYKLALSKFRSANTADGGSTAATFTVMGIPLNSNGDPPLPGDAIVVYVPGYLPLASNSYVLDKWVYEEPPGVSSYTIGHRPQSNVGSQLETERAFRHQNAAEVEACWTSWWRASDPAMKYYYFDHHLGVIPRTVTVNVAAHTGLNAFSQGTELLMTQVDVGTITEAPTLHADPTSGNWVGFQVVENSRDRIGIYWADWMAYSKGKWGSDAEDTAGVGWCQRGNQTAFSVSLEP